MLLVTHDPMEALSLGNNVKIMLGSPARIVDFEEVPKTPIPRDSDDANVIALYGSVLRMMEAI